MIRMIAADMDGTLLDSRRQLPPGLFDVIRTLKKQGVLFVVASGRQYYNLVHLFDGIRDDVLFVSENGAAIFWQDKPVFTNPIPFAQLGEPLACIANCEGLYPVLCGVKSSYIASCDEQALYHAKMYYNRLEVVPGLLAAAQHDDICKIAVHDAIDAERNGYPILSRFSGQYQVSLSGSWWVDIMKRGVSKGAAIKKLQQQYGIAYEETMAFGDYLNDVEMLQAARYSFAMENAHPQLKSVANFQARSNDDNGVLAAIVQHLPI